MILVSHSKNTHYKIHVFVMNVCFILETYKILKMSSHSQGDSAMFYVSGIYRTLYSSANNFLFLLHFALAPHSSLFGLRFHLFVLVFDFSAHFISSVSPQNVHENAVLNTVFISGAIASMLHAIATQPLQPSPTNVGPLRSCSRIPYIQITFCLLISKKKESKTYKTVNRISIHKF